MTRFEEVARLREGIRYPPGSEYFQNEQLDGEMIQVSPGCYEGSEDGYVPTGEVLIVKTPGDPECYPEPLANFEYPEDAANYVDICNATPWLLEAAACFQPGDADLLRWMRTAEGDAGDGSLEEVHDAIESLLIRMEKAAEIMEGQE